MPKDLLKIVFWGVRGSTPTVDRANWRYGGNTPCVELIPPKGKRIILDCGSGLRMLGRHWLKSHGGGPLEADVFVSHYHWDHIQGIPFFAPLYSAQNRFHFYSFRSEYLGRGSLQRVLEAQMAHPYFPVDMSVMTAARDFSEIGGGERFELDTVSITARWLNHPQGCLGFRFETPAGTLVYATDNEPGVPELDRSLCELAAGADIFINDAQYTPEQLATSRKGWGHSTWVEGVRIAREAGVHNLVLFHHDPDSSDKVLDERLREARKQFASTWAAAEGMIMTVGDEGINVAMPLTRAGQRRETHFRAWVAGTSEEGNPFEEETVIHDLSLHGAYLYLRHAPPLQSELKVTLSAPGGEGESTAPPALRGYVVRREPCAQSNLTAVGVVFTEEIDAALAKP